MAANGTWRHRWAKGGNGGVAGNGVGVKRHPRVVALDDVTKRVQGLRGGAAKA